MKAQSKGRKSIVVKVDVVKKLVAASKSCENQRAAMAQIAEQYSADIKSEKPVSIGWIWSVLKQLNLLDSLPKGRSGKGAGDPTKPKVARVAKTPKAPKAPKATKEAKCDKPTGDPNAIDHSVLTGADGLGKTNFVVASSPKGLSPFERKFYNIKEPPSTVVVSSEPRAV